MHVCIYLSRNIYVYILALTYGCCMQFLSNFGVVSSTEHHLPVFVPAAVRTGSDNMPAIRWKSGASHVWIVLMV